MTPHDIPAFDWAVNLGAAVIGGAIRFMRQWQTNYGQWSKGRVFFEGVLNALYAGFAAILTFMLLQSWGVNPYYSIFACGVMGHMGPEGVSLLSESIRNAILSRTAPPPKE